jgi:hypothetical protein
MRTIFDIMKTPADVKTAEVLMGINGDVTVANDYIIEAMKRCPRGVYLLTLEEAKELGWVVQPLKDKDPIIYWDNDGIGYRRIGFYDGSNKCVFDADGDRDGLEYDNYELLPLETAYIIFGGKAKYEEALGSLED